MLYDPNLAGYQIAWPLIFAMAIVNGLFFFFIIALAFKARRKQIVSVSGREELIGLEGNLLTESIDRKSQALIHGEIWNVETTTELKKRNNGARNKYL